jgi:hypothetical protein
MLEHRPALPKSFVDYWREKILPEQLAPYQDIKRTILDLPNQEDSEQASRIRNYGMYWTWWKVNDEWREWFWAIDCGDTPPHPPDA